MVKKLFKHEFMAMGRMLLPMYIILLGLSILTRFIVFFENDSVVYDIISGSSIVMLVIGIFVSLVFTEVAAIIRFYKNLFSKEGYLSFTLPVSVDAHILTKLATSVACFITTLLVVFSSFCIATSGELLVEIFKAAAYIFDEAYTALGMELTLFIIEASVLGVVAMFTSMLLMYACMCIGQLAKRSRVLLALGVYFGYYYLTQAVATVGMIIFTFIQDSELLERIFMFIENNPLEFTHMVLIGATVITAILGGVYYLIAHSIMKKRLNLE